MKLETKTQEEDGRDVDRMLTLYRQQRPTVPCILKVGEGYGTVPVLGEWVGNKNKK